MTRPTIKIPMIADLSEEEHKSVEHTLHCLSGQMKLCEAYLKDYTAGNQNAFKTMALIFYVHQDTKAAIEELKKAHKLPDFVPS
jgi:hypothetical protein